MAKVQNSSSINITRVIGTVSSALGNKIFNGYVYNLSLTVGFNGEPSALILNLALDKTLKNVSKRNDVIDQRKKDIASATQTLTLTRSGGAQTFSVLADNDFDINENHIGIRSGYNISINGNSSSAENYELFNFKIISYSISKKNNEKILTLTLHDNSIVLNKIFVGVLGQHVALDLRSEKIAKITDIKIFCPAVNLKKEEMRTTHYKQLLHFTADHLAKKLKIDEDTCILESGFTLKEIAMPDKCKKELDALGAYTDEEISQDCRQFIQKEPACIEKELSGCINEDQFNYITIKSKDLQKSIQRGYGAVILVGEEDFKDSQCSSSEVTYSFSTLLAAMKKLGIKIFTESDSPSLIDKSKGRIKKNFSGTLKDVLNQWCDIYSYSYVVDFSSSSEIVIKGIDLSSNTSKETVMSTKLNLEDLETSSSNFVIQSQDFDYDLSQKKLNLYSSFYFKEARDNNTSFESSLGDKNFYNMNLASIFPKWFGLREPYYIIGLNGIQVFDKENPLGKFLSLDFCGAGRGYKEVITSAVLGRFSPKLRQIYNYRIGAFRALGFLTVTDEVMNSKLNLGNDTEMLLEEAISSILEIQSKNLFDAEGDAVYDFHFGFYNQELVNQIERIESYIADFLGKHYWTDYFDVKEGSSGNENSLSQYEITSMPAVQKYYDEQLYSIPLFTEGRFLIQKLNAVYEGSESYFNAYSSLIAAKNLADTVCKSSESDYIKKLADSEQLKKLIFYSERPGSAYGVFEELIRQIEIFEYSVGTSEHFELNLADLYSPGFKELSPVTLALLQAVLPVNISSLVVGDFKFGLLYSIANNRSLFTFEEVKNDVPGEFINPIELQNQIRSLCEVIGKLNENADLKSKKDKKNDCSKTVLYEICVFQSEMEKISSDASAVKQSAQGPNPLKCRRVKITRKMPPQDIVFAQLMKVSLSGRLSADLDEETMLNQIRIHNYRLTRNGDSKYKATLDNKGRWYMKNIEGSEEPAIVLYTKNLNKIIFESIIFPSEETYKIRLMSKTSSEVFVPFEQFVKGGLEDSSDISKILESDAFSVDISLNNVTPNIRGLFGDQSTPAFALDTVLDTAEVDPVIMHYQGYTLDTPAYQFTTLTKFHETLKKYYDEKNISIQGPAVSFSAELFCSSISSGLKDILSVNNGLSSLNMTLGEGGLNLKCQFNSRPAKPLSMETLIYNNKPNIKFQNTNFLV